MEGPRTLAPSDEALNRRQRRVQLVREAIATKGELSEDLVSELCRLVTAEDGHIPILPNEPIPDRAVKCLTFSLFHDMINFGWALDVPAWPWAPKSRFVRRQFPPLVQEVMTFSCRSTTLPTQFIISIDETIFRI